MSSSERRDRPWTTPNAVFKVMPFFDAKYLTDTAIVATKCEQETVYIYPSFQIAPFPMTLNDPKLKLQGHAII